DLFGSHLDESLIVAIAGDFDLFSTAGYNDACAILRSLAQHAITEEASGFDSSGVSRILEDDAEDVIANKIPTARLSPEKGVKEDQISQYEDNGAASSAHSINISLLEGASTEFRMLESDAVQLQNLFPDLKSLEIRQALIEANGVVATALDILLSVQYFHSAGHQPTSLNGPLSADDSRVEAVGGDVDICGCDQSNMVYSGDRQSNRKVLKRPAAITYIAERLNISAEDVSIIYTENKNSKGATLIGILDQFLMHRDVESLSNSELKAVDDFKQKYRYIPDEYLKVIIQITGPASTYATDLVSLANAYFSKRSMNQKVELDYRLTPLPRDDIDGVIGMAVNPLAEGKRTSHRLTPVATSGAGADLAQALEITNNLQQQKHDAIASAASLYRRGASNPLYRQAAGYYVQQAREHARRAQEATSTVADIHVNQQSTNTIVDLHGVSVQDGVRIARQRALDWWQKLPESQEERNLTIITGLGRHNAGGASPLRKAVAAALTRDGWKFRVETGKFIITGRG
ncbi:smr domain-containing, partial [Trichoderma arundinaceum]